MSNNGFPYAKPDYEALADKALAYLGDEGAVRIDNVTVKDYRTVYQICDHLRITTDRWYKVKEVLNRRGRNDGYSICYIQGKGHYKGYWGEDITNDLSRYKIAKGWERHLKITSERIKNCSARERFWIEQRDSKFTVD